MEKKTCKKPARVFFQCLIVSAFAMASFASSSTKSIVDDPDFQKGYRIGSAIGEALSDAEIEGVQPGVDSVDVELPLVAVNN